MTQRMENNLFHWIATTVAVLTAVGFIAFNYRGIFAWQGIGVYTIPFYVVGAVIACILWIVGRLKSRSRLAPFFWGALSLPLVFVLLLPKMFFV